LHLAITFGAYLLGAAMGLAVHRGGPRLRRGWPVYLRIQLVVTAATVGLFSAWRLTAAHQVIAPILIAAVGLLLLGVAHLIRGSRSGGFAALEGWAAFPNASFWVLPMVGPLVGTTGTTIAALSNAAYLGPNTVCIHLMRRDAPIKQRRSTGWFDQSMTLAVLVGLALHLVGSAPSASTAILNISGPLLAFVGAGLYTGSVLHPHNTSVEPTSTDTRRWLLLTAVRIAYLILVAVVLGSHAVAVVAILSALGPPAFYPPQQAVLYGYRSGVVMAAVRWGWLLLPIGLVAALLVR
jgi:hypothetical protein